MTKPRSRKTVTKHKTKKRSTTAPKTKTRASKPRSSAVAPATEQPSAALKAALNVLNSKLDMITTHVKGIERSVVGLQTATNIPAAAEAPGNDLFNEASASPAVPASGGNGQAAITKDEVSQVLNELMAKHGAESIQEILTNHGAKKLSDLTLDQYPSVLAAAAKWEGAQTQPDAGLDFLS